MFVSGKHPEGLIGCCCSLTTMSLALTLLLTAGCSRSEPVPQPVDESSLTIPEAADPSPLSESDRKFLWDVEHLGFVLEQTVFPRWNSAVSSGQTEDIHRWFSAGFEGKIPAGTLTRDPLIDSAVTHYEFSGTADSSRSDVRTVSGKELLEWIRSTSLSGSDSFTDRAAPETTDEQARPKIRSASLGLVRLFPVERDDFQGSWISVWKYRITTEAGASLGEFTGQLRLSLSSLHDDIADETGWIQSARILKCRQISSEAPLLAETTATSGINVDVLHDHWRDQCSFVPNTGGLYVSDYNDDGHLDVFIDDQRAGVFLYRGSGDGRFTDQTTAAGITSLKQGEPLLWALSTWGDFDNDGDDDLITEAHVFENNGDGTFSEVTDQCNLRLTPAAGYAIGDYDGDGLVDLYVCHSGAWHRGTDQQDKVKWIDGGLGIDNVLWRNMGNWQFEDVTHRTRTGADGSSSFSAVWLHADSDNRPDLFSINEFGRNALLRNQPNGGWLTSDVDSVFGGFSMGVTAGDFNNDGYDDVYVSNMYSKAGNRILANVDPASYPTDLYQKIVEATIGNKLYCGTGDGRFHTVPNDLVVPDVGWAYGAEFVDLNLDGWLDIYVTAGFKSETRGKPDG